MDHRRRFYFFKPSITAAYSSTSTSIAGATAVAVASAAARVEENIGTRQKKKCRRNLSVN